MPDTCAGGGQLSALSSSQEKNRGGSIFERPPDVSRGAISSTTGPSSLSSVGIYTGEVLIEDPRVESKVLSLGPHFDAGYTSPHTSDSTSSVITPKAENYLITDQPFQGQRHHSLLKRSGSQTTVRMPKKRPSLQSILVPSFLQQPPQSPPLSTSPERPPATPLSRTPSQSYSAQSQYASSSTTSPPINEDLPSSVPRNNSPPLQDFLDEDPFANLSGPSVISSPDTYSVITQRIDRHNFYHYHAHIPATPTPTPRSPLSPPDSPYPLRRSASVKFPSPSSSVPRVVRPRSSGSGQVRPAHTRPAFKTRPSLPSLHTLAQMNIIVPSKVRKGKVGARLPYEPWDMLSGNKSPLREKWADRSIGSRLKRESDADFTLNLPGAFPDFSDAESEQDDRSHADLATFVEPFEQKKLSRSSEVDSDTRASLLARAHSDPTSSLARFPPSSSTPVPFSHAASQFSTRITPRRSHSPTRSDPYSSSSYPHTPSDGFESDPLNSPPDLEYYTALDYSNSSSGSVSPTLEAVPLEPSSALPHAPEFDDPDTMVVPGTSANTIRGMMHGRVNTHRPFGSIQDKWISSSSEPVDGDDPYERNGHRRGRSGGWNYGGGGDNGGRGNGGRDGRDDHYSGSNNHWQGGGSGGGRRRDDDRDGNRDRRPRERSTFSASSGSEGSSEDEDTTDYGEDDDPRHRVARPPIGASPTDDDVPLAQRIPTALTAQKSIRKQVRDERDQRRKERARREQQMQDTRSRQATTSHRVDASHVPQRRDVAARLEEVAPLASAPRRTRTNTMPSSAQRPFAVDDLTKKLMSVQASGMPPGATLPPSYDMAIKDGTRSPHIGGAFSGRTDGLEFLQRDPAEIAVHNGGRERSLRPMRSFHRSESRTRDHERSFPPTEDVGQASRSGTTGRRSQSRAPDDRHERSTRAHRSSESRRSSRDGGPASARTSDELDHGSPALRGPHRPPVPPLPPAEVLATLSHSSAKVQLSQQRIFIGDMQRFNMVEMSSSTNARDVLQMVESQGALEGWAGVGGWMLWEVAQDFGMERPVRNFELLSDITGSWNKDKMVNTFVIKRTPLASLLSSSAIPTASPIHSGYVEWESKRGKWNKRWLELREHSLWLAKRNTGKDQTFLCSVSNFDAYFVTRLHKSPKPFVFAVKSTDNLSFFENAADYVHVFSCGQKEGETWIQKILLARSYVLHQERNVLFAKKSSVDTTGLSLGTGLVSRALSRSGTRKQPPGQKPAQPLFSAAATSPLSNAAFEPGSLLGRRTEAR